MFNEYYEYEVHGAKYDGALTIDYRFTPLNSPKERRQRVKLLEVPHEDLRKAWQAMKEVFADMWGMPLVDAATGEKLEYYIRSIKFVSSAKYGDGLKITAAARGLERVSGDMMLTTETFYRTAPMTTSVETPEGRRRILIEGLTPEQAAKMDTLKTELFAYAHMGKKEQPTLEEAAQFIEGGAAE